ncbi:MAG TPA: hypothetical protein PKA08_06760, partial [Elusimicrobiota bacterium]|nr:hypothetical protein [Elusimicrobiota bacterium]
RALVERAAARAQRERLAAILGLAPGSSMGDIAFRLGRVHRGGGDLASIVRGRGWPGARLDARQAHDVAALISLAGGWSLIPNLPKKALKVMREYHRGEGLVDFHERIVQSLTDRGAGETPRVVLFEITTNLLDGKTKLEGRDEAIRRALEFWARRPNTVVNRVVWVLPQGRSAVDLIALFRRTPALAPLLDGGLKGIPIVSPPTQKGRLKSITALLLRAQNLSNPGELRPADLYLLNRSEWDLSDLPGHLKGLVNFLILLAGDVVFDATDRLADDVKRLNVVSTNA